MTIKMWAVKQKPSFFKRVKQTALQWLFAGFLLWGVYYFAWGRHLYLVTAYCNCAVCINVPEYRDGRFASGKPIYWGGIAADPSVKFGSKLELVPHKPSDWAAVYRLLNSRRNFKVEDRGGKIKGRHIDVFIPDSMGGHKAALRWGVRKMRVKINGKLAE